MRILSLFLLAFVASGAHASKCGKVTAAGGTAEALPRLIISTKTLKPADALSQHFADMFQALKILPEELELPYSQATLALGHWKKAPQVQRAINELSQSLEGSVTLRFLALLCQTAAADSGAPEHSGDLFLTLLNRASLNTSVVDGQIKLDMSEGGLFEYLTQTSVMVFPTLATMREGTVDQIAVTTLLGMRHYQRHLNGNLSVGNAFRQNFLGGLAATGYEQVETPQVFEDRASGVLSNSGTRMKWSWEIFNPEPAPHLFVPSFQNLKDLPFKWSGIAKIDGKEFMGLLSLRPESGEELRTRIFLIEQVLHPLFVKAGAYKIAHEAEAVFVRSSIPLIEPEDWKYGSLFEVRNVLPFKTESQKLLAALAQVQKSAVLLAPAQSRAPYLMMANYSLLNALSELNLTFLDLEKAVRAYGLPIHYAACPQKAKVGEVKIWVGGQRFAGKSRPPTHTAVVVIENPDFMATLMQQWKLTDETNRTLLETQTGLFQAKPFDPARN